METVLHGNINAAKTAKQVFVNTTKFHLKIAGGRGRCPRRYFAFLQCILNFLIIETKAKGGGGPRSFQIFSGHNCNTTTVRFKSNMIQLNIDFVEKMIGRFMKDIAHSVTPLIGI